MTMEWLQRGESRYTPFFCEENVWWLARNMVDRGVDPATLEVMLFSNPSRTTLLFNQRAAAPGQPVLWDYHVVLRAARDNRQWCLDLDTRLPFPVAWLRYLHDTFPVQSTLPSRYRALVRTIPAAAYLAHFCSDRSHMLGEVPRSAFPDYPIIEPPPGEHRIALQEYWNMRTELDDGSIVQPLGELCPELA